MDRRQLRTLLAVVENRSFSAAARALGTVQSNVSAHVARLERELGVTLVDRASNEPTEEGRVVVERARRIEAEFEALEADVASLRDVVSGTVRLGVIGTTARWLVPPFLRSLSEHYPAVQVIVLDATTSSLVLNLGSGTVDLAVLNLPVDDSELLVEPLFEEERVLIAPHGHELAGLDSVTLAELDGRALLLEAPGTAFRDVLDAAASDAGVELRAQAEFDGMRLLTSLAFAGFGAGIVPASAVPTDLGGPWRAVPVEGLPRRSVGLARRRRGLLTAAQRAAAQTLREVVLGDEHSPPGVHPLGR